MYIAHCILYTLYYTLYKITKYYIICNTPMCLLYNNKNITYSIHLMKLSEQFLYHHPHKLDFSLFTLQNLIHTLSL